MLTIGEDIIAENYEVNDLMFHLKHGDTFTMHYSEARRLTGFIRHSTTEYHIWFTEKQKRTVSVLKSSWNPFQQGNTFQTKPMS